MKRSETDLPFFFLWFGAAVSLSEILAGTLLAPLGLWPGVVAIVLGHAIGTTLLVLGGVIGTREGYTAIGSAEAAFGRLGKQFFALLNVIQLLGWTAVMLKTGAGTLNHLSRLFWHADMPAVWVGLLGLGVMFWVAFGRAGTGRLNVLAVILLIVLTIAVFIQLLAHPGSGAVAAAGGSTLRFGAGLELVVVMPLSWLPLIADYNRRGHRVFGCALNSWLGYFVGSSWMYLIGLLMALHFGGMDLSALAGGVGTALLILVVIVLSTVTTTFMDAYSAGVSWLLIVPRGSVRSIALVVAGVGVVMALYLSLKTYENFLYMIGALFSPLYAIVLGRYFVLRPRSAEGRPLIWPAMAVWIAGVGCYYLFLALDTPLGATVPAFLCTGAAYLAVQRVLSVGSRPARAG